ncbi:MULTISPECIES: SDR family NAD(P)-dependent oxidoreductase [Mycobacteriaceae]|uniref:SDR family NAD(P)-dependent oxidoreductase n=1 Tax=Mycolicibacterium parafortuitum TaxID=39692 RepID=A0ACC6MHZ1_MYCPF|nr:MULTISPECIES: SDR family NAD(P)-dependent oxidoreductase [Mycobacteriaceae]MDZ5086612.1 SDR family NAD(P)-dependent oxidoreductase [Mycolicibacterium parafortuitum]GFM20721.1 short chain dehydrogenase [Mycobacterium sp. PO1]GFM25989.1 short chain dehydrogenase [Mycobacterium sp. PO2]
MSTWTTADIPDQSGRTAVITGANTGLGFETAKALADKGARVVLAVRDTDKGRQAAARIGGDVTVQELDLTSLASIRAASEELHTTFESLDLLINNAGVMTTPKATTKDGFELQFGTNHLGHFALTGLLLDRLLDVDGARIVTVSSNGHKMGGSIHFDDLQWERRYNRMGAYTQSKLANLLFTYELQRRLAPRGKTVALAAHPGTSTTELARNLPRPVERAFLAAAPVLFAQTADKGALPTLRAATDPGALGGQYYGPDGVGQQRGNPVVVASSDQSYDLDLQRRLWTVSEELTKVVFPVG